MMTGTQNKGNCVFSGLFTGFSSTTAPAPDCISNDDAKSKRVWEELQQTYIEIIEKHGLTNNTKMLLSDLRDAISQSQAHLLNHDKIGEG